MNRTALLALLLLGACSKPDAPPAATDAASATTIVDPAASGAADVTVPPADTMAFRMKEGTEVWLTAGRVGRGTDGVACRERGVELRKGEVRKVVPLLYVTTAPRDRNDSLFARLSTDCVSTGTYSIDIVSGQPTPFERSR
jgi:hypothetical protein